MFMGCTYITFLNFSAYIEIFQCFAEYSKFKNIEFLVWGDWGVGGRDLDAQNCVLKV